MFNYASTQVNEQQTKVTATKITTQEADPKDITLAKSSATNTQWIKKYMH